MPPARRLLAEAWLSLASRLRARGDVKLALGACRQALSLAPSYADGHRQLALNFQALQRYQEAIRSLRRLLALKPRDQAAGATCSTHCRDGPSIVRHAAMSKTFSTALPPTSINACKAC